MCGINGIICNKSIDKQAAIGRMNARLAHRGPNAEGCWAEGEVAMGHRRLSIIDLTPAGNQPMTSACGRYVMVYNGEVYNFRELRKELDYPFKSNTDSEVVLAAWSQYGKAAIEKFEGMFAIAIWDKQDKKLTLVRDRMGVKPLYWSFSKTGFVFSSEMRALLASGLVEKRISETGLIDYLRYQTVQTPNTIIENVQMLPPATLLEYSLSSQNVVTEQYWDIREIKQQEVLTYDEAKSSVRDLFFKAVEKRLVADVPFGAFLSGGIDSSAVVGAMARISSHKVKTFNINFAEEDYSEAKFARHIAQMHNTDHHEIQLSPQHFLEHLPQALKDMDHPSGDGPNTWMVSQATKAAGIDMALSGLGGDEVFCGYAIFRRMARLEKMKAIWSAPNFLRRIAGKALTAMKPGVASSKMADLLGLNSYEFNQMYAYSRQVLSEKQIGELLASNIAPPHIPVEWLNEKGWNEQKGKFLSRVSIAEMETYMQNVLLRDSDQMSMAHALELRVPFMDHQLIEYALSLPDHIKFPHTPKKLLVDSLPDLLPPYIVNRHKMGFVFPWEHWLKNELYSYADARIKKIAAREPFNKQAVLNLWDQFLKGNPKVTFSRIWPLVVLEEWMEKN